MFTVNLATDIGKVRLEIGDTDENDVLLTDEQIQSLITQEGGTDVRLWAARCCETIARRFMRDFNFTADGTTVNVGDRAKAYADMAASLRTEAATVSSSGLGTIQTMHQDGYQRGRDVNHVTTTSTLPPSGVDDLD